MVAKRDDREEELLSGDFINEPFCDVMVRGVLCEQPVSEWGKICPRHLSPDS